MSEREREDGEDLAWLLARERAEPGPALSEALITRYARLTSSIAELPAVPGGATSRAGWQQDVLAAIDAAEGDPGDPAQIRAIESAPRRRTRHWPAEAAAAAAFVAIAAVVAIVLAVSRERDVAVGPVPSLAFEVESGGRHHRTGDPSVGDTLILRAVVEGSGELRVYGTVAGTAGVELARCGEVAPDCTIESSGSRTTLRLTLPLRAPGELHAVLFAAPLVGPSGGIDADVGAATRAGIVVTPLGPLDVH